MRALIIIDGCRSYHIDYLFMYFNQAFERIDKLLFYRKQDVPSSKYVYCELIKCCCIRHWNYMNRWIVGEGELEFLDILTIF